MRNDELISELIKKNSGVKVLATPVQSFLRWLIVSLFSISVGVAILGVREDYQDIFKNASVWIPSLINFLLALASALSAFIMSIPDRHSKASYAIPVLTFIGWIGALALGPDFGSNEHGFELLCLRDVIVLGIVPAIVLVTMLYKGAVLKSGLVGCFALMASASLGAFATQFICHDDAPLHILLSHLLPVVLVGVCGIFIGRKILRKKF
ncbi:MAG: DUF1109 family protein [Bdellovibrionales bacterium]|nr:DUF1109 family protein [Bdellovibrionales bacterium]